MQLFRQKKRSYDGKLAELSNWYLDARDQRVVRASAAIIFVAVVLSMSSVHSEEAAGILPSQWVTGLPSVVIAGERNVIDPVSMRTLSGALLVAAESFVKNESVVLVSRSADQGRTWNTAQLLVRAKETFRVGAGAAGTLPSGRLVLVTNEWKEIPGTVAHVRENPVGVHHYLWNGFHRVSTISVWISDDDGATWTAATTKVDGGPLATSGTGRVFAADGAAWLPIYGPSNEQEMDASLSSVGIMRSADNGQSWRFSHWIAKANETQKIGYGTGDITILPDGRWLGLLQGNYRGLGDYTRPRVCRTISADGGRTWSIPEQKLLNHGCSTVTLDNEEIMVGGWKDRGIMFTVGTNAGEDWLYQDQVWWCIWYGKGNRGGTHLLKLDDGVLAVYHWMDAKDNSRTEVRAQVIRRASGAAAETRQHIREVHNTEPGWRMAEAYQVPDIPAAPAGIRIKTMLKLRSGDWTCLGYVGSKKAETAYGFAPTGVCTLRSAEIAGPWKKIADVPMPKEVGGLLDTGTGAGVPGTMVQHSSGRLFLPLSTSSRKDIILTYSDDEGKTWQAIGSMAHITGMPAVHEADKIVERKDGSLVFPMQRPYHGASKQHPLFYVCSNDRGATWSAPVFWATHVGTRYEGLPHGPFADFRETSLAVLGDSKWLGVFRESRGTLIPENVENGPLSMPFLCLARSHDDGRTWKSSFGFLGVEPDLEVLPGGAVMAAYRDDNFASVWISYDKGASWQIQHDPAELPWKRGAAEQSTQWPPGGEPIIRVIDENTVAVICDSGMIPAGKLLPADYKLSREFHGRVQVRFFRRMSPDDKP